MLRYERRSGYLVGLGVGFFIAGLSLVAYSSNGWIYVVGGIASMIVGGIYGSRAKQELKGNK